MKIPDKTFKLFKDLTRMFAPPSLLSVSEWADQNRHLPAGSAEPGLWRTSRVPYMKEIMDCFSANSIVSDVCFMKGAQTSGSESANNWIGYIVDQDPGPTMLVQPSVDLAKKYSKQRIAPMFRDSPILADKIKDSRTRDSGNTILTKEFKGGILVLTGANSAAGLRSMPAKNIVLDEVDAYPLDVEGEGDPVDLIMARTRTYARRKVWKISTPTVKETSRIEKDYLETDQRKYFVPCPQCGHMHVLEWANFVIPKNATGLRDYKKSYMKCPACEGVIKEQDKSSMLEQGEWRMTYLDNEDPARRGYHISSLYSPIGWFSWAEIAKQWLDAQGDISRLKTFVNTVLGETFEDIGESLDPNSLYMKRRIIYDAEVPDGVLVLTASVDVQDDRLEYECVGWGVGKTSYGIEYGVLYGDPGQMDVWNRLDDWLQKEFSYANGIKMRIACTCIDSGGHFTNEVYLFCKGRESRGVFAIKGRGGSGLPLIIGKPSRNNRMRVNLFSIGVDTGKEILMARLKVDDEESHGYCYFPRAENGDSIKGYDETYFKGLTSEKRKMRYKMGKKYYTWEKKSTTIRNEPLDLRNYNTAALEILNPNFEAIAKLGISNHVKRNKKRRNLSSGIK